MLHGLDARLGARLLLVPHVDARRGVVAHEHDAEPGNDAMIVPESFGLYPHLLAYLLRYGLAVDNHRPDASNIRRVALVSCPANSCNNLRDTTLTHRPWSAPRVKFRLTRRENEVNEYHSILVPN